MTVSPESGAETWIRRYYQLCGAKDIAGAMEFWAPDGKLTFANFDTVIGRDAIHEALAQIVHSWIKETHTLHHLWVLPGDLVVFEMDVAFDRHDGRHVVVPGAAVCRVGDRCFLEQRIYVDMAPVFAPSEAATSATA
ncbi:nuclear transport factor 2 family protein [Pseudonocardia broussonetiae]|uniref:Nuclear transport factor 2 family protein n=1 Tax=Pseudonocardia broussonetiae TaxID=2736640 RepID=A0A6M6JLF0_9PSEU|nr:nuclear transport factor 2 family protein [Pseudonocardia broussonetiae]QJY48023.1 nuclear transport factor 2 family protein [Pseudonocardia broussonetiae]